jgi:hypothetical protein
MAVSTAVETRDLAWSPVLDGLNAPALDCIQTGLAALADLHHGSGSHLALGARLEFAAAAVPGRAPTVEVPVEQRLAEARELAGLRVTERRGGLDGAGLRAFAASAGPLYVVADAFDMAWTPYCGQRHMDHSFVLLPGDSWYKVVDPYHNETEWGVARPGVWRLSTADLDAATGAAASAMVVVADRRPQLHAPALLAANAGALAAAKPDIAKYLDLVRAGADRSDGVDALVLDIWLLGRSRLLHAAWLGTVAGLPAALLAAAQEHAQEWLRLAAQSYVGMRRVQRGGALPVPVVERLDELLRADVALAARLADAVDVRAAVVEAVRAVLRLDAGAVDPSRPFRTLPNFNSFRLVEVIERVESGLGVELDADDLTLDALHDVDSLARLFARTLGRLT